MAWLYYILLLLVSVASLALVIMTLPGLWLMTAAAAIYAVLTHETHLGFHSLMALFVISLIGEIVEFSAGGAAAKKAGGGRRAAIGALLGGIVGGIIGSFVFPIILSIVGVCIGAFAGAAIGELSRGREAANILRVGWGAASGRFVGMILKFILGIVMILFILIAAFP